MAGERRGKEEEEDDEEDESEPGTSSLQGRM